MDVVQLASFVVTFISLCLAYYFFSTSNSKEKTVEPKIHHLSSQAVKHEPKEDGKTFFN
jgi:hypothetical protein